MSSVTNGVRTPLITEPDMFYGRIDAGVKSSTATGQAQIINNYLNKLHNMNTQ
ncbi:hypothetical protein [Ruminiclostridium herbifermentans]|uniref:hypothetical protein n=1 Tax=Ruminiclostridium herbifermentans TaxID=2488810 RepID=UPI0014852A9F|nr:hypothetical protein [Ruminiclostridium herbifermentans]